MSFKKIHVLQVSSTLGYAGTERALINFCRYYTREYFQVSVVAYMQGGPRERVLKDLNIPYLVADGSIERTVTFIAEQKINIVHFYRSGHFVLHEYELIKRIKELFPKIIIIETNIFGKHDSRIHAYIDCSIQISKVLNERYAKQAMGFNREKTKVIYFPVDCESFEHIEISDKELDEFKRTIGIQKNDFVIGRLGRPHIAKWGDLILDMMKYVVKKIPNIKFVIQSAPESRIKKMKRNKKLNKYFIFLDETSDDHKIALFYKTIDVYVHSSKIGEGFGMSLVEAGIFRKPVIVNSTPHKDNAQVEIIDHLKNGVIANYPQTFARAVEYLYKNPQKKIDIGNAWYEKVTRDFSARKIIPQIEKVFIEIMVEKGLFSVADKPHIYTTVSDPFSKEEISLFKNEYAQRLYNQFGNISFFERMRNYCMLPRKFYFRIRDFIEHRFLN